MSKKGVSWDGDFTYEDWVRLQIASRPYPELTPALRTALRQIEPVKSEAVTYWPCRALRISEDWQDCVYLTCAADWFPSWGIWPSEDPGKGELNLADVKDIQESPSRLPARFAKELYKSGESGMGYTLFEVEFADGSSAAYTNGNAIDFLTYPPEKSARDVVAVRAHAGRNSPHPFPPPKYSWCFFSGTID
jgi:hypothetical protein